MAFDRDDLLQAFRAVKAGAFSAGDLRKALRKQNAATGHVPLSRFLPSDLPGASLVPDPRADRLLLDQISAFVTGDGILTAPEFEKLVASVTALPAAPTHPPLDVPQKLGEYEVRWEMGREEPSVLFRGWHPRLGDVALKIFRPGRVPSGYRARVSEPHPGLVRMIETVEVSGFTFLAMELVEGQALSKLLAARKLSTREALALVEKSARTLAELHARGLHHGSLRSSDLLVHKGEIRIKDFGGVVGSASDDVRAFAEILYEAAAGVPPYAPSDSRTRPPLPPGVVNKALDPDVDRLVRAALENRYPGIGALAEDLGRWLRGEKISLPAAPGRRRKLILVAGAALVGIAVGAFAVSKLRAPKETDTAQVPSKKEVRTEEAAPKVPERTVPRPIEEPERKAEGPMTPSEERALEERCYQAALNDPEELGSISGRCVKRGPKRPWSYYYYARFLHLKRRFAEALSYIEEAVLLRPDSTEYLDLRFRTLLQRGEVALSLEDLRRRYEKRWGEINRQIRVLTDQSTSHPRDGSLYLERGAFWSLKNNPLEAERDYDRAVECGVLVALHFRAHARARLERVDEALEDVTRFFSECPDAGGREEALALRAELEKRMHPR